MNAPLPSRLASRPGLVALLLLVAAIPSPADELRVAVAGNFADTLADLAPRFEAATGHRLRTSQGSTGKLYAQIVNGAPFDAFLAADARRPRRLEEEGLVVPGTRTTYARGRIVLWAPEEERLDEPLRLLRHGDFRHLVLANPRLAPYGLAPQQTLTRLQAWSALQPRLIRGQTVGQACQFVESGAAELGFVALSQVRKPGRSLRGATWLVPAAMHDPIEQQAVLLTDTPAARSFLDFLLGPEAGEVVAAYGYSRPLR